MLEDVTLGSQSCCGTPARSGTRAGALLPRVIPFAPTHLLSNLLVGGPRETRARRWATLGPSRVRNCALVRRRFQ